MMKNKLSLSMAAAALLGAAAVHAEVPTELLGEQMPLSEATRTVEITPQTRYVNVTEGSVVRFVSNGQAFAIHFDAPDGAFDLARLAPPGALDHPVKAYVAPDLDNLG